MLVNNQRDTDQPTDADLCLIEYLQSARMLLLRWVLPGLRILRLLILSGLLVLPGLLILPGLLVLGWIAARPSARHLAQLVEFAVDGPLGECEHDNNNQVDNRD